MSGHHPFSTLREMTDADPARKARSDAIARAMKDAVRLEELRTRLGNSEYRVSRRSTGSPVKIPRIEVEEDGYLSTLRAGIEELGGELEVVAVFPEGKVMLAAKRP